MPKQRSQLTVFESALDDECCALLFDYCETVGRPPSQVIAELLKEVLIDDATEHGARINPCLEKLN